MSTQEKVFSLLRDYGFCFALIFDVTIVACYGYLKIDYSSDSNLIIGNFFIIVLSGFTVPTSLIAILTVMVASKEQWGEVEMLKTYIGIGSLMGLIAAGVTLIKAFEAV